VTVCHVATFGGALEEQAEFMSEVGRCVDVPVILSNQIASFDENDEQWMANAETLMKRTGDIPLGIYETPVPRCRALTPEMVEWAASTGKFVFLKDPVTDVNVMNRKITAARSVKDTPLKYYTAKLALLSTCLELGGHGFCGISLNFFPHLITWMCHNYKASTEQLMSLQRMFSVAEAVAYRKYPASSKYYIAKFYGIPMKPLCRVEDLSLNDQDKIALKHMNSALDELQHSIGGI
jgi:4-hydroxy-tetrahydrodipicolinate synthase